MADSKHDQPLSVFSDPDIDRDIASFMEDRQANECSIPAMPMRYVEAGKIANEGVHLE